VTAYLAWLSFITLLPISRDQNPDVALSYVPDVHWPRNVAQKQTKYLLKTGSGDARQEADSKAVLDGGALNPVAIKATDIADVRGDTDKARELML
jgi:hypothetical protein